MKKVNNEKCLKKSIKKRGVPPQKLCNFNQLR